jgi:hypothetical protein
MYVKALCFAVIALISGFLLVFRSPTPTTLVLAVVLAWASARLYYFCFYVIERYIDPSYRFDGLLSVVRYLLRSERSNRPASPRTPP